MNQISPHNNNDPPWWFFFVSLLLLCFAGYLYHYFTDFEATGGTRRINWFIALTYELGGKWTLVGVVVLAASCCAYLGFDEIKSRKQVPFSLPEKTDGTEEIAKVSAFGSDRSRKESL